MNNNLGEHLERLKQERDSGCQFVLASLLPEEENRARLKSTYGGTVPCHVDRAHVSRVRMRCDVCAFPLPLPRRHACAPKASCV